MAWAGKSCRTAAPGVGDLWRREVGGLSPRSFAHRVGASEDFILRLGIHRKLDRHEGCVNTISFNADGSILASGSDDRIVMLWNWDAGIVKLSFDSGHSDNVFQARFMPFTEDRTIVTCAADGEVRLAKMIEGGEVETTLLGQHEGRAHKLAIEPGNPYIFYSCGEDGLVQHFDLRTKAATKFLVCKPSTNGSEHQPIINLNAITIDPRNPNLFAVGGTDEYARVYDVRKYKWDGSSDCGHPITLYCPPHLVGKKRVGITGLAFSDQSELLSSYNDELIYLFSKDQELGSNPATKSVDGLKSVSTLPAENVDLHVLQVYKGHCNSNTVKGVSFVGPNCEYVASGSDCGRLFIWRRRDGRLLRAMDGDNDVVNCIEAHPYATVIASSGIDHDVKIWTPNATERAPPVNVEELKPRPRRNRLWHFPLLDHLVMQELAMQRRLANPEQASEGPSGSAESLNLELQVANGDGSSDENGEASENPGDCTIN